MMNRSSSRDSGSLAASRALRGASLLVLATLAVTSQLLGGCIGAREIGDDSGDGGGTAEATKTSTTTTGTPSTTTTGTTSAMTTGPTGGNTMSGGSSDSNSIAIFNEQVPSGDKPEWSTDGKTLEPKTLIISLLGRNQTCAAPKLRFTYGEGSYPTLLFGLSTSVQKVGKYDLASSDVLALYQFWSSDGMGNGGGGSVPLLKGTIEVLSIDDMAINVRIELQPEGHGADADGLNGDYLVPRCP